MKDAQDQMRELSVKAVAEFDKLYPQTWSAVWRVEPYVTLGRDLSVSGVSLPVAAGLIIKDVSKKEAVEALLKSMRACENTEDKVGDVTHKYISICTEGVFVLLLRNITLLVSEDEFQRKTRIYDNNIESIYRFRDGAWRHIWGDPFFEMAPDVDRARAWANSVR